jgi:hypothetical protein
MRKGRMVLEHKPDTEMVTNMSRLVMLVGSACLLSLGMLAFTGCEKRERILEVETPGGSLQIDRVEESSDIEIDLEGGSDE